MTIVFVGSPLLCGAQQDVEAQAKALKVISDFAQELCKTVKDDTSSSETIELTGDAKAQLKGAVQKLVDLGISGAGKYSNSKSEGVLQKDLAKLLGNQAECRYKVWQDLKDKMLSSASEAVGPAEVQWQADYPLAGPPNEIRCDCISITRHGTTQVPMADDANVVITNNCEQAITILASKDNIDVPLPSGAGIGSDRATIFFRSVSGRYWAHLRIPPTRKTTLSLGGARGAGLTPTTCS